MDKKIENTQDFVIKILSNQEKEESPILLEAKGITVTFNRKGKTFNAVENVDFFLRKGEIVGVVGESGSGKTTLGKTLLNLWSKAKGEVFLNGQKTPTKKIRHVTKKTEWIYKAGQMIFQNPTTTFFYLNLHHNQQDSHQFQ